MSSENKCNCRHCNGHIAFDTEMAGQSINCPHCQLETLLFIPNTPAPPVIPTGIANNTVKLQVFAVIAMVLFGCLVLRKSQRQAEPPKPTNLHPATEAFGWKLGDSLPEQLKSEVRNGHYYFRPKQEMPPFENFELGLTDDGRVYSIEGSAYPTDSGQDADTCKSALISLLSEKYGLRYHDANELDGKLDVYEFGTEDQSVRLGVFEQKQLTLRYCDKGLQNVAYGEQEAKRKKDEDDTKAALKKGL